MGIQRKQFKTLMARFSFDIRDIQHKEWFIAALVPHIRKTTNATEDRNTKRGSRNCNEVRSFTYWGDCNWYESNLGIAGKLDASVTRH